MCRQERKSCGARQAEKDVILWQKKVSFINDGYIVYIKLIALKKKKRKKKGIIQGENPQPKNSSHLSAVGVGA